MNYLQFILEEKNDKTELIYNLYKEVSNFSYGVLIKNKLETDQSKFSFPYMIKNYKTFSDNEIKKYKSGICFDHSFYISKKLNELGIKNDLFFINTYWYPCNLLLAHVFCIAELNGTYYYLETASGENNGLYKSKNKDELLKRVINMLKNNGKINIKYMKLKESKFFYDLLNIHNNIPKAHTTYSDSFKFFYENGKMIKNCNCKEVLFAFSDYYLKNPLNETLETRLTKPISNFQKEVTLYHGTDFQIPNKIIDPAFCRLNTGTRISKIRYSTWWTRDPYFPYYYSINGTLFQLIRDLELVPKDIKFNLKNTLEYTKKIFILDHKNHVFYFNKNYKKELIEAINRKPGYVYSVKVPWKIVGRGHDRTLDEYTLDIPVKTNEDIVNFKTLCKHIEVKFVSEDELLIRHNQIVSNGSDIYSPNIMEKLIYRTLDQRKDLGTKYRDVTRRYYEK